MQTILLSTMGEYKGGRKEMLVTIRDCTTISCSLCGHEALAPIREGVFIFCCFGCRAVFQILSAKKMLDNFQEQPVFQQAIQAGLISNPALLNTIRARQQEHPEELKQFHLEIHDMWCPACAEVIRLVLLQIPGVQNCVVDYSTDLTAIEYSPSKVSQNEMLQRIKDLGYRPILGDGEQKAISRDLALRFTVAAFCSLNVMMFAYPIYAGYFYHDDQGYTFLLAWLSFAASLPVVSYSAWPILKRFWNSLKIGLYGMEALVFLGVGAAFSFSTFDLLQGGTRVYFDSMTVIIALVLLGKIIESKAKFSAKEALCRLTRMLPRRGRKQFSDGIQAFVPIKEIKCGDVVIAHAGEKVVLDGVVIEGTGACDESLITGEAIPLAKKSGSTVVGGSIIQAGSINYRVTHEMDDSMLQRIVNTVQQNLSCKSSYVRAADQIVRWFVPTVGLIALGAAGASALFGVADPGRTLIETAVLRMVSVLLISCPCAIGIAAPLAEAYMIDRLAALGVIIRNRGALALLGKETLFAFDKTGTITEGKLVVLQGLELLTGPMRSYLKGVVLRSNHLIAQAIAGAIAEPAITLDHFEECIGKGVRGSYRGISIDLGSELFLQELGITVPTSELPKEQSLIHTSVGFAVDRQWVGNIVLGDRIRHDAAETIASLTEIPTMLLSGDGESSVAAVASSCKFTRWYARCSPLQKREEIERLKQRGHVVCMVGDGINDAPALTNAHIGISTVSATDFSIQVSDLLLTTDRLTVIPEVRTCATFGRKIIKQNLFWTFFYNGIGIALAAIGMINPLFSAFAMVASSSMVLLNTQRIKRNK